MKDTKTSRRPTARLARSIAPEENSNIQSDLAQDSNSEDSSTEFVRQAEFRSAIDDIGRQWQDKLAEFNRQSELDREARQQEARIFQQQSNENQTQMMLQMMRDIADRMEKNFEDSRREVHANMESLHENLDGMLLQLNGSMESLGSRVHNVEVIEGYARRSPLTESASMPSPGASNRFGPMPTNLALHHNINVIKDPDPTVSENRRGTIIGSVQSDAMMMRRNRMAVESDDHLKITWTENTLDGFLTFVNKVGLYQKSRQQAVPCLFTHCSREIQDQLERLLLTKKPTIYRDKNDVSWASLEDISQMLLHVFVPYDLITFNELLFNATRSYRVQKPAGDVKRGFENMRSKIYTLRESFRERYRFLVEAAKATNNDRAIPALSFKDEGLFNTWLLLTPTGMRNSFQKEPDRNRYDSLEKFFDAYFFFSG